MSGMDLYEELLRAKPSLAERVIFLTGGAFTPRSRDFLATASRPYLEKPFDPSALRRAVASLM